jgi:ribosome maturation factor RimP
MSNIAQEAQRELTPIIEALGYEVVEIGFKKVFEEDTLEILIHRDGGITLEDCVLVNDALERPLEELDLTRGKPYNLNISSVGLDRPLVSVRDFERRIGEWIEAELKEPVREKDKLIGKLKGVSEQEITVNIKGRDTLIKLENIKSAKPHIKFGGNND